MARTAPIVRWVIVALILGSLVTPQAVGVPSENERSGVVIWMETFGPPLSGSLEHAILEDRDGERSLHLQIPPGTANVTSSRYHAKLLVPADLTNVWLELDISGRTYQPDDLRIRVIDGNGTGTQRVVDRFDSSTYRTLRLDVSGFVGSQPTLEVALNGTSGESNLFVREIRLVHPNSTVAPAASQGASNASNPGIVELGALGFSSLALILVAATFSRDQGLEDVPDEVLSEVRSVRRGLERNLEERLESLRTALNDMRQLHEDYRETIHDNLALYQRHREWMDEESPREVDDA